MKHTLVLLSKPSARLLLGPGVLMAGCLGRHALPCFVTEVTHTALAAGKLSCRLIACGHLIRMGPVMNFRLFSVRGTLVVHIHTFVHDTACPLLLLLLFRTSSVGGASADQSVFRCFKVPCHGQAFVGQDKDSALAMLCCGLPL